MKFSHAALAFLVLAFAAELPSGYNLALKQDASVSGGPDKDPMHHSNYKKETKIGSVSIESTIAAVWCCMVASVPILLVYLVGTGKELTRAHKLESGCLLIWLVSVLVLFTNFVWFNSGSGHWDGARPLTIIEAVYLLSQILTTVGYGDITPAYPMSQVLVAVNVIIALCLYGSLISEVVGLISEKFVDSIDGDGDEDQTHSQRAQAAAEFTLIDWNNQKRRKVDYFTFQVAGAFFCFMAFIGVLFWHYYPGEEKTWLQAVYFSVITLSTVGFGALTATTPGGMVFGAFWMLFGVAALGATIGSFITIMVEIKARERDNADEFKLTFFRHVQRCARKFPSWEDQGMDKVDYLKFGLLVENLATPEELKRIEERWRALCPQGEDSISKDMFVQAEAPPGYDEDKVKLTPRTPRPSPRRA